MNFLVAEMQLREHHCLGNKVELMPAPGPDEIADDPLNAWIPRGTIFVEENVSVVRFLYPLLHLPSRFLARSGT